MRQTEIHIRSYGRDHPLERHDFAQFVLPLQGSFDMEIAGRMGRLSPARAAFVEHGVLHSQEASGANRSLIVDVDMARLPPFLIDRLRLRPFPAVSLSTSRLVDYMALLRSGAGADASALALPWLTLLVDGLWEGGPVASDGFATMLAAVEADVGSRWTTRRMAATAGMSVSRLHARFRDDLGTTPHSWLNAARLRVAGDLLAGSDVALSQVALAAGYGDQSSLSRAMRRGMDTTPAAYRRSMRETAGLS